MKKILCLALVLATSRLFADSFSIYEENDCLEKDSSGSTIDGYYTQGLQLQYENDSQWGIKMAQQIYTPENKDSDKPQYGDRPYAGYLHGAWYKNFVKDNQNDYLKIDIGIIGPASLAEETQKEFHRWFKMAQPQGWQYQLRNEPALNVAYYKSCAYRFNKWIEFNPLAGANGGNVLIDAEIGSFIRCGYNMPRLFNPTIFSFSSTKEDSFFIYTFAGVIGQAIAYDHLLDGSLFQDEQVTVKHNTFVANGSIGAAVGYRGFELSIAHTEITEQWNTQPNRYAKYDSIKITCKW